MYVVFTLDYCVRQLKQSSRNANIMRRNIGEHLQFHNSKNKANGVVYMQFTMIGHELRVLQFSPLG
jgi:ribosomal protein S19